MATKQIEKENTASTETTTVKTRNSVETFFEDNKNIITYIAAGLLALVLLYGAYRYFIIRPQEQRAQVDIMMAQRHFERDSLRLALFGDGINPGFLQVADEYSATTTGNLAKFYAGVTYLNLGEYENAIDFLDRFSTNSKLFEPIKYGLIGDAYSELQNYSRAADNYRRAARADENNYTAPLYLFKAGLVYEELGNYNDALDVYQRIMDNYPESNQGQRVEKYIARAEAAIFANRGR